VREHWNIGNIGCEQTSCPRTFVRSLCTLEFYPLVWPTLAEKRATLRCAALAPNVHRFAQLLDEEQERELENELEEQRQVEREAAIRLGAGQGPPRPSWAWRFFRDLAHSPLASRAVVWKLPTDGRHS
jgi:hypothetical protein